MLAGCAKLGGGKPAALQVTSIPEASVFLDGRHLGKTPFFSDQLKAGDYLLKVTAGDASFVEKITLNAGTLAVVNRDLANNFGAQAGESLWLSGASRGLFVSSIPQEAEVVIDGQLAAKTPFLVEELSEGEHKISLRAPGFVEREFAIKSSNQYQVVAEVTLASEIAKINPTPQPVLPVVSKIEVKKTPLGFLRVRKEPSLNALEVGRVKTGEVLEVIQETDEWLKVKFGGAGDASKEGWISAQYTKKI